VRGGWIGAVVLVAAVSVLAAGLTSAVWLVVHDTGQSSGGTAYTGIRRSFTADLASGHVSAVKVNLSVGSIDVTSDTGNYSVNYPSSSEVLSLLAQHPKVRVTSVSAASPATDFWLALAASVAASVLMLAGVRILRRSRPVQGRPA
jgi:hypothetical protein